MKKLIFIGGPMGVGKTAVSKELQKKLKNCVYLDGDWCWFTNPWILTDNTKNMVIKNIAFLLNNFLTCPDYEYIILSWILYDNAIVESILSRIRTKEYSFIHISLIAKADTIVERLTKDLANKIRTETIVLERSLERLTHYPNVDSIKIDTTYLTPTETANEILKLYN